MKYNVLFGLLLVHSISFSQSISPGTFAAAGGDITSDNYSVEWILSEVLVPAFEGSDYISGGILGSGIKYVITDVNETVGNPAIRSYPNPFSERLSIEGADMNGLKFSFYDVVGKEIYPPVIHSEKNKKIFLTGDIPSGIYFLRITGSPNLTQDQIKLIRE